MVFSLRVWLSGPHASPLCTWSPGFGALCCCNPLSPCKHSYKIIFLVEIVEAERCVVWERNKWSNFVAEIVEYSLENVSQRGMETTGSRGQFWRKQGSHRPTPVRTEHCALTHKGHEQPKAKLHDTPPLIIFAEYFHSV